MLHQAGVIPADNAFDIVNISRALLLERLQGPGVGLISPGGGTSVVMTDCSVMGGLEVPVLAASTRNELSKFVAKVNTIIDNPVDLGAASYLPKTVFDTLSAMAKESRESTPSSSIFPSTPTRMSGHGKCIRHTLSPSAKCDNGSKNPSTWPLLPLPEFPRGGRGPQGSRRIPE